MSHCKLLLVLFVGLWFPCTALAQVSAEQHPLSEQETLARKLASHDWSVRHDAVEEILAIPAEQRSRPLILAVLHEITRLERLPALGGGEVPDEITDPEVAWDHFEDLVRIACQSSDPIVIPVIVEELDIGSTPINAIARFGEVAAPEVLKALRLRKDNADFTCMAMESLTRMLERHEDLSATTRAAIGGLVGGHLSGTQDMLVVVHAMRLAGALRGQRFRPALTRIARASTPEAAGLSLVGVASFEYVRQAARAALEKIK